MTNTPPPKALTYDEKKAAEAAFAGHPFNEAWSASARSIYDGIAKALPHTDIVIPGPSDTEVPTEASSQQTEPVEARSVRKKPPLVLRHRMGRESRCLCEARP